MNPFKIQRTPGLSSKHSYTTYFRAKEVVVKGKWTGSIINMTTDKSLVWNNEVSSCGIGTLMNNRLPGSRNIAFSNEKDYFIGQKKKK